jgi:hypothetical protein
MLVLVRYGDNRELLVNSWCKISVFFDYVRKMSEMEFETELELDLCDSKGEIMRMAEQAYLCANNFLKEKEKYILLRVERKVFDQVIFSLWNHLNNSLTGRLYDAKPLYTPLLNNDTLVNDNFLSKLNPIKKKPNSSSGPKSKNKSIMPKTSRNKNTSTTTNSSNTTNASISSETEAPTRSSSKIDSKSSKDIDFNS